MLLRHLRYFVAAADEGSLAAAARRLRVAQPALSRQIQELERAIGTPLFTRDARGVRLTVAGSAMLAGARVAMDRLTHAVRRTRLVHRGELGTIRMGLGRWALHTPEIGRSLSQVRERYPGVDLVIVEAATLSQTRLLLDKALDIAVGLQSADADESIAALPLYTDPIDSAALPSSHALATGDAVAVDDLRELPLISIDRKVGQATLGGLYDALESAGFDSWEEHATIESVYSQVAAGRGWSHAPRSFRRQPPEGTLVVPVDGFDVPFVISARWRRDDRSALTANIVNALAEAIAHPGSADRDSDRRAVDDGFPAAVELRHVKALVAAADKPLRAAAAALGLTESAVSRQIATLERAIGVRLTEHVGNRLVLTRAGETWCAESAEALRLLDDAVRTARRAQAARPCCIVGAVPSELVGDMLVNVLRAMGTREPPIVPEIREVLTPMQIGALRSREIDIAVAGAFPLADEAPDIASMRLADDVVDTVLLAKSHPLANREWLDPADLRDAPFIFVSRDMYPRLHDRVMRALEEIGLTPRMLSAADGPRVIWRMVADTLGWTVGRSSMRARPPAGLVGIPLRGLNIGVSVYLLWRRDEDDPGVLSVVEAFRAATVTARPQTPTMS